MTWILMLSVGAVFGGLFLGLRDLLPYLAAKRSGVIARKGARAVRVHRDEDPDGFARLMANRSRGAAIGFGATAAGALVLGMFGLAVSGNSGPYAVVALVVWAAFVLFAVICLIRGFATGRMFSFWSLTLFGEATLKGNPAWFWTYTALNVVIVLGAAWTLMGVIGR